MHYWYGSRLSKSDTNVTLDTNKLMEYRNGVYTSHNDEEDEALISKDDSAFTPTRKSRTQTTLGNLKQH